MKIYNITKGQLWVIRITLFILFLGFLHTALDSYNNEKFYLMLSLLSIDGLLFYEIGWRNFNNYKKIKVNKKILFIFIPIVITTAIIIGFLYFWGTKTNNLNISTPNIEIKLPGLPKLPKLPELPKLPTIK